VSLSQYLLHPGAPGTTEKARAQYLLHSRTPGTSLAEGKGSSTSSSGVFVVVHYKPDTTPPPHIPRRGDQGKLPNIVAASLSCNLLPLPPQPTADLPAFRPAPT
jgi:hypothetical protein